MPIFGDAYIDLTTVLKLLVKYKLLHSGKVPVNAEPTRNGSSAIRHFEAGDENVFQFPTIQDCHYISPLIHTHLSFHCLRKTGFNDTERTPCNKNKAPDLSKPLLPTQATLVIILSHFKYGYCHLHVPCFPLGWGCFQCNAVI